MELNRDMGYAPKWKRRCLQEEKTVHESGTLQAPEKSLGQTEVARGKAISLI